LKPTRISCITSWYLDLSEETPIHSKSNGKASSGSLKTGGKASSGSLKTGGKASSFSEGMYARFCTFCYTFIHPRVADNTDSSNYTIYFLSVSYIFFFHVLISHRRSRQRREGV
jgi:hypothetical protein